MIPTAPSPTQATSAGASPSEPVADQWTSSASEAVEVTEAAPKRDRRSRRHARAEAKVQSPGSPRSARLFITHVDPWSVMKQAFLLALAIAVIILVAAAALWFALDSAGVLDAITRTATDVGGESGATVGSFFGFGTVMGAGLIIAAIETVLVTALSTLFAFMYNLSVGIGGGLEVTLSEEA